MKCEAVGPGDDAVDRRKLGLKYLKSSSKPHLNLIVNLSRWCYRKSPKILSHDHGQEVEIFFVFLFFSENESLTFFWAGQCVWTILRSILQVEFTKLRIQRW